VADRAVDFFSNNGDDANLARALFLKANGQGAVDLEAMADTLRQAQVYAARTDDEQLQIQIWDELGGAMLSGRTPYSEVAEFTRAEQTWARERGIAFTEADGMLGEAYAAVAQADWQQARKLLKTVKTLFGSLPGVVGQHGESYALAGQLERDAGRPEAAEPEYRRAMELFDEYGSSGWSRSSAVGLANTLLDLGRSDEGAQVLADVASRGPAPHSRLEAVELGAQARLAAVRGDVASAVELSRRGVEMMVGGSIFREAQLREQLAEFLAASGDTAAAREEFERAAELYAEKGYRPGLTRVNARLARLVEASPSRF
jgi:tetratricopeptide (TPR) repeat protein